MGWNPGQTTKDYTAEDQSWLASAHGTEANDSGTLAAADLLATFPDGTVPSGVVLGKIADGRYVRYDPAGTDGRQDALYHLFTTTDLGGTTAGTVADPVVPLFWHGEVIEAKLPALSGIDAAARAALNHIRYV